MTDNVTNLTVLHGDNKKSEPNPETIEMLEELLVKAKEGRIQSLVTVTVEDDQLVCGLRIHPGDHPKTIYGLELIKMNLLNMDGDYDE